MPSATSWIPSSGIGMSIVNVREGPGGGGGLAVVSFLGGMGWFHELDGVCYVCLGWYVNGCDAFFVDL